jgi:predicted nucleic acid-binding protein
MKVFLDTNVLLDVIAWREPFYEDAARIWSLSESGKLEGLVSAISFNNIYYIVRKASSGGKAQEALVALRNVFTAVALSPQILSQAIDGRFEDFEDAIQYYSAIHAGAAYLITRNADHFPSTGVLVLPPAGFLALFS